MLYLEGSRGAGGRRLLGVLYSSKTERQIRYPDHKLGTVLNDRIIDFLIEHNVNLLVSLDEPRHRRDRYGVFPMEGEVSILEGLIP